MTATLTDLSDPTLYRDTDPTPLWARLRAAHPLYRNELGETGPFWAALGHGVATEVLRDPGTFVSGRGMRLDSNPEAVAAAVARRMLIVTDPPVHTSVRRVIGSAFTPRMVRRLEENMRVTVRDMVDRALAEPVCDLTEIAAALPVSVVCDLIGVPREDWHFMLDRTRTAWGSTSHDPDETDRRVEAHTDLLLYYEDLLARRRARPAEDMISALAMAEVDGRPLSDEEILLNCDGLVSGGNETTRHASVGGLLALADNPDQWRRLRADPSLLDTAVPEILRWTSPAMHALRTVARDVELAGQPLRAGERVAVWLPSANRDETVFAAPDTFDVGRTPNRHLTFAHGNHRCVGATLATTELRVLFTELTARVRAPAVAGEVRRLRSNLVWGYEKAEVALS
ncbi:cytochrome [Actinophytocola xinjiangensis]|uniref:Cytochrome n=1 Tax=Actinophytocola xinjiangensis TaxID=485602 RepID=A0A7Z1AUP6_9PSEU|nr:cytochrome P450 [Actinophytocola xinjiangensis]OLF04416.1 cytochrome [Actinophytocola xinjiangensis]